MQWNDLSGLKQSEALIYVLFSKIVREPLNINYLYWVVGLHAKTFSPKMAPFQNGAKKC
jgi:hypothetical protein